MSSEINLPFFRNDGSLLIRQTPRDSVPTAVFEGVIPTPRERARILSEGLGLHLVAVPPEHADLKFLGEYHGLTCLGVIGAGLDTRRVAAIPSLVELELSVTDPPETDLAVLPALMRYSGLWQGFESVLHAPSLVDASFHEVVGDMAPVPRSLGRLSIAGARKVHSLSSSDAEPELTELVVEGARRFDVSSLLGFPALRILSLQRIGVVEGASAIAELPLAELGLVNCRAIDDAAALGRVRDVNVTVAGGLARSLKNVADLSHAHWTFLRA